MTCRICGDENGVKYRDRSRMFLCEYCHKDTPRKATIQEFAKKTFLKDDPNYCLDWAGTKTIREFYDDYKTSKHTNPVEYWEACSG